MTDMILQKKILEAILFASPEPISAQDLHERLPDDADMSVLLKDLSDDYKDRGINLIEVDNKWAFRTSAELSEFLVLERHEKKKLSRAAMETLSIIAYHQPVTRVDIENIRGVATSKGTLDVLLELEWVKPGRRRETPGRPLTWVVTTKFLDHFSLESITDLPGIDELKAAGLLDRRPAIETIPSTGELFNDDIEKEED